MQEKYKLITKQSLMETGTNACYSCIENSNMNGLCIKMTFTFSAEGTCAPLFITVGGLIEQELPGGSGFKHCVVPGLCIGELGVNVDVRTVGHVFSCSLKEEHMWKDSSTTKRKSSYHSSMLPARSTTNLSLCQDQAFLLRYCCVLV